MFKYYKNLFTYISMAVSPEAGGIDLPTEKQNLIRAVNDIQLSKEQLAIIKSKIEKATNSIINNFTIEMWRRGEINKINSIENTGDLTILQEKYKKLKGEIKEESESAREELSGSIDTPKTTETAFKTPEEMIKNLTAETERKYRESENIYIFPNINPTISASNEETNIPKVGQPEINTPSEKVKKDISVTLDKEYSKWVKENLEKDGYFKDINNPAKNEITSVLNEFKDTRFEGKQGPEGGTSAIFAIQGALQLLGNTITVDGVYGNETKSIIREFQTNNKLTPDGIPGPKTITVLLSSLEK